MSQWNYLKLEIGILDCLLRQQQGFEDFISLNFSKILLKFAFVFKILESFCHFLSLTIITGQRSFSSLADGLRDITQETKTVLNIVTKKSGSISFKFCNVLQIFKISVIWYIYLQG